MSHVRSGMEVILLGATRLKETREVVKATRRVGLKVCAHQKFSILKNIVY